MLQKMGTTGSTPANAPVGGGKGTSSKPGRRPNPPPPGVGRPHPASSPSPALKKSSKNYVEIEGVEEEGDQLEPGG